MAELSLVYWYWDNIIEFVLYDQLSPIDPNYNFNTPQEEPNYKSSKLIYSSNVKQVAISKIHSTWVIAVGCEFTLDISGLQVNEGQVVKVSSEYDEKITIEGNLI